MTQPAGFAPLHQATDPATTREQPRASTAQHVDPSVFVSEFTRPLPDPAETFSDAGYVTRPSPTCGFATASLILALVGVVTVLPALLAIGFGHLGVHRTRNHRRVGRGMAMGGTILGYAVTLFWAVLITTTWIANG